MPRPASYLTESLLLLLAVASMASSVIFIRLSELPPGELSAWRLIFGGMVVFPWFFKAWRRIPRAAWPRALAAGVLLGLHFITWVMGARGTVAANATLLVNLVPLVLPLFLLVLAHEPMRRTDWLGSACGLLGVATVLGGSLEFAGNLRGDLICLGSMFLLAAYIALGRRAAAQFPTNAAWVAPVFLTGALVCLGSELAVGRVPDLPPPREWAWIACLVVFPTLLGHMVMNRALRFWRGQVVGVASSGQFLFAGAYAWGVFGELPAPLFPLGAVLVVIGVWVVAR